MIDTAAGKLDTFVAKAALAMRARLDHGADGTLDDAWRDAELAMPEGWVLVYLLGCETGWTAIAEPTPAWETGYRDGPTVRWLGRSAHGDTPGAALVALTAKLRRGGE